MKLERLSIVILSFLLVSCDINKIPEYDEQVKAAWSEVHNQYQRRYDLVPNLVSIVSAAAEHESTTLIAVTEARAKASSVNSESLLKDENKRKEYEKSQADLSAQLSRMMILVEQYPTLQANQNFVQLSSQYEGVENRIAISRREYIQAIQIYNSELRTFPGRIWHKALYSDLQLRDAYFESDDSSSADIKFK